MKRKLLYALIALVGAFLMWIYVITTVRPGSEETFYNISVDFQNEEALTGRGLALRKMDESPTVTLKLSGNRSDLSKLTKDNITIAVDLAKIYQAGKQTIPYTITYPGNVPPNSIEVISKNPANIQVQIVEYRTLDLPIEIDFVGQVPEGYGIDKENVALSQQQVRVSGPADTVDRIRKATITVDLKDRTESLVAQPFPITLLDADGATVETEGLTMDIQETQLTVAIERYQELKLMLEVIPGGGATPENTVVIQDITSIYISGSDQLLEGYTSLKVGEIHLGDYEEDQELEFDIRLKEGVTNVTNQNVVKVRIEYGNLAKKKLTVDVNITDKAPEGMKAEILTKVLELTLRGKPEEIEALTAKDVRLHVDFSNAQLGKATYIVSVELNPVKFGSIGAIGTYTVTVDMQEDRS